MHTSRFIRINSCLRPTTPCLRHVRHLSSPTLAVTVLGPGGTKKVASCVANLTKPGDVILLDGDLGVGKTTFARGFLREKMNDPHLQVTSPTFILTNEYEKGDVKVHHIDLYRLDTGQKEDFDVLQLDSVFQKDISLIEWPQRLSGRHPEEYLDVNISIPPLGESISATMSKKMEDEDAEEDGEEGDEKPMSTELNGIG
ncbi:hypothetical protein PROFUN_12925 [Planoprotostelium fungivorum]|uniref:tRNA threonylcarbamoyladenosine biosynthesis protein TsaE n=1 Tax=Planoprotostelium fungivorum TaxID=1890364 RepID=A0A2P6N5Z7_9EUKA|nr:hypothetical protein PROFUN_12925 [Planoprotostelium fungivorum]